MKSYFKNVFLVAMLFIGILSQVFAQGEIIVTGRVTSGEDGEGLPGVNVVIKGTTQGTVTDAEGKYSVTIPSPGSTLVFSSIGYTSEEIAVDDRTTIDITLIPDVTALDEVVVIGYGEQSRRNITGSVASVTAKDIEQQPVSNLNSALQGRVAGVQVQHNSGMPGAGVNIRIRGISTLGGSDPLYIIDGVPVASGNYSGLVGANRTFGDDTGPSALSDLNPNDIESIQVLKDAAATSIYGSRASNGVVIITTKRGKAGKPTIDIGYNSGLSWPTHKYDLVNTEEFIQIIQNAYTISGAPGSITQIDNSDDNYSTDVYTDWQDEILRDQAFSTNANLNLRGGNENLIYAISTGYLRQDGVVIGSGFERLSARINAEYSSNDWIRFGSNFSYSNSKSNPVDSRGGGNGIVYRAIAFSSPTQKLYDEEGNYWNGTRNIVQYAKEIIFESVTNRVIGNIYTEIEFFKGLSFKPSIAIDGLFMDEFLFFPNTLNNGAFNRESTSVTTLNTRWVNENLLRYNKEINGNADLEILVGYSVQEDNQKRVSLTGQGGASDAVITNNGSSEVTNYGSFISESAITSLFSRVNLGLKDRYLFSGSVRRDGSSRFGKDNKYGFFPSFSAGWRISDEDFLKNSNVISDLKLRASWGITGNQNIGDYQAQGIYQVGFDYDGISGIAPASNGFPNTELTWETTNQYNLGIDLSLTNGITLYADVYKKITDDILFNRRLPNTTGYNSVASNIGSMENTGVELALATVNINKNDFQWNSNINFSANRNVITSLPDGNDVILGGSYYYAILREGESVGSITAFESNGLYKSQEEINNAPVNTIYNSPITLGDIKYIDQDGDGRITDPVDRKILGQMLPKFTGGFGNEITYKALSLNFFIQFSYGNKVYNMLRNDINYKNGSNFDRARLDAYHPELNPDSNIPRVKMDNYRQNSHIFFLPTDIFLEDASYVRLKTVTLSYRLGTLFNNGFLNDIQIYATGQNLLTLTKYKGFDPESNNDLNQGLPGADRGAYPVSAMLAFGVNVKL